MIEKVICHKKVHVMYNLIACVYEGYNKLLDLYGSLHSSCKSILGFHNMGYGWR